MLFLIISHFIMISVVFTTLLFTLFFKKPQSWIVFNLILYKQIPNSSLLVSHPNAVESHNLSLRNKSHYSFLCVCKDHGTLEPWTQEALSVIYFAFSIISFSLHISLFQKNFGQYLNDKNSSKCVTIDCNGICH